MEELTVQDFRYPCTRSLEELNYCLHALIPLPDGDCDDTTGPSTLLLLPDEILVNIFQHLSAKDLSSICLCCSLLCEVCKDDKLWRALFKQTWAQYNGRFHREVPVPLDGAGWRKTFENYFGASFETWWSDAEETDAFTADDFLITASPELKRKKKGKKKKVAMKKPSLKKLEAKASKVVKERSLGSKLAFWKRTKQRKASNAPKLEYRMMLCGAGGIGAKSALIIQFLYEQFVTKYDPTIEDTYEKRIELDEAPVDCVFLDVAGQEEFAALRPSGIRWAEGFLVGYSITSRSSFESAVRWRREILNEKKYRPPMVLVGNKADLEGERQVSTEEGKKLAEEWGCSFFETSCKTRDNVEESIFTLIREMQSFRELGTPKSTALVSPNGTRYAGMVLDNKPHGLGTCEYSEKDNPLIHKYSGWWENGQRHGTGRCWYRTGKPVQGEWRFGKLHSLSS